MKSCSIAILGIPARGRTRFGLSAGDRLGPYEIVGMLGTGGVGEVYRARVVAIKAHGGSKLAGSRAPRYEASNG